MSYFTRDPKLGGRKRCISHGVLSLVVVSVEFHIDPKPNSRKRVALEQLSIAKCSFLLGSEVMA